MSPVSEFAERVLRVVRRIPPGKVATYGDVAALAGRPGAARAVGTVMRRCCRRDVPAHRVVGAGGALGGYGGNLELKRACCGPRGWFVGPHRIRGFARVRWTGGRSANPAPSEPPRRRRRILCQCSLFAALV